MINSAAKHPLVPFGTYDSGTPLRYVRNEGHNLLQQPCV